ncbi:MAG: glycerol kinase GlpK [Oscillospiraceae bacterium]|nr:glycerol kinase GlpK [Oscillospiraceae bacterium]
MERYVMALDQGTTSSRAIVFDERGGIAGVGQVPFRQHFPQPGWVEHDPEEILASQLEAMHMAVERGRISAAQIAGIGITNQRETTVVWDRHTGRPVCNAVVWQCRRTSEYCEQLIRDGLGDMIMEKTGLLIDAYFSATKIRWILENVAGARERAERGDLLFGTVDSWLIWNLTGRHATDPSNACRTMLFNIDRLAWDEDLCRLFGIPVQMLPEVLPNSGLFGTVQPRLPEAAAFSGIPVCGSIGDQQAALFGQGCLSPGEAKNTYGTGCFTLMNSGNTSVRCANGLLTDVAWSVGGKTTYALEGSIFNAGSSIQWLRDELGLISTAHECDLLAESVPDTGGVYAVSAFTGLGAPHWDMRARGIVCGITRGTGRAHLARAVLEGIAYQVKDMLDAMEQSTGTPLSVLKVDGGASVSNFMMQFQADILDKPIDRPKLVETTALGAAFLAGLHLGVWPDAEAIRGLRTSDRIFEPHMDRALADRLYAGWKKAVERSRNWAE